MGSFASKSKKKDDLPPRIIEVTSPSSDDDTLDTRLPSNNRKRGQKTTSKHSKRTRRTVEESRFADTDDAATLHSRKAGKKAHQSPRGATAAANTASPAFEIATPRGSNYHSTTLSATSGDIGDTLESTPRDCTVLFEWSFMEAEEVSIAGTFSDWESIEMHWNHEEEVFQICLNIFAGTHMFRYIVDGEVRIDPRIDFADYDDGHPANVVTFHSDSSNVSNSAASADNLSRRSSVIRISSCTSQETSSTLHGYIDEPEEMYGQEERLFQCDQKNPPLLPPHISYTPLNYPTLRTTRKIAETTEDAIEMPMHVTLQHVYLNKQYPGLDQIGMSARYQKKWISVEFFAPKRCAAR